jgi:hypothetical protein
MATKKTAGKIPARRIVLVRSSQSGVWIGVHVSDEPGPTGRSVHMTEARKIWRWRGANTTSELALRGCSQQYSRVAEPVETTVHGCCEVTESNEEAFKAVSKCGWGAMNGYGSGSGYGSGDGYG